MGHFSNRNTACNSEKRTKIVAFQKSSSSTIREYGYKINARNFESQFK